MLPFQPLPNREDQVASIALDWCLKETQSLPLEEQLEWALTRLNWREFLKLEKLRPFETRLFKQMLIHRLKIEQWGSLVGDVCLLCAQFYTQNAPEISPATAEKIKAEAETIALQFPAPTQEQAASKRLQEKMQSESTFKKATLKENPDTSPDKIQLELEDGVAYISKKSGWVLSQF